MTHVKARSQLFLALLFNLLILPSCATVNNQPSSTEAKNQRQYWLSTSMYAGQFYDDDKHFLVDARPFSTIDDAQTFDGYILYPPAPTMTIPAGTLVKIDTISYPDDQTRKRRPIYSPRNNVWVYLRFAAERGRVNVFREKPHILVLPKVITTEQQVRGYLSRFLSVKDPNRWILHQESHIQDGIFEKRPVVGMKREHLIAALGPALKKQYPRRDDDSRAQEIWHYTNHLIEINDDKVSKVHHLTVNKLSAKTQK